jgi:hypothetical protein
MVPRKIVSLVQDGVDCTCIEDGFARSSGLMRLGLEEDWKRLPRAGRRQSTSRHLSPRPCENSSLELMMNGSASTTQQSTARCVCPYNA